MDQRTQFLADHQRGLSAVTELCARYAVSRKTGYKWLARYAAEGPAGLHERSHAPHRCPQAVPAALAELLLAARRAHPTWGHLLVGLVPALLTLLLGRLERTHRPRADG